MLRLEHYAAALALTTLLCTAACGDDPTQDILDIEVESASFSNPQILAGGVAMGWMVIWADLAVTDGAGGEHNFPVAFSGFELGSSGIWTNQADQISELDVTGMDIDLPESVRSEDGGHEGPLTLGHVFGDYTGMGFGMHAIIGGGVFYFDNDYDVTILFGGLTPGIGVTWGMCPRMQLQLREDSAEPRGEGE